MPEEPLPQSDLPAAPPSPEDFLSRSRRFLSEYIWFILRNLIGWILILTSPVLGALLPGPGGLPVFIIGFWLVTFPGKRRLTARVLRGKRLRIEDRPYAIVAACVAILIPAIALWIIAVRWKYEEGPRALIEQYAPRNSARVLYVILAIVVVFAVTRISLQILNILLRLLPRFRRKFRPWMQRNGFKLLPPRRRKASEPQLPPDEILEISDRHRQRVKRSWAAIKPWLRRAAAIGVTVWIFSIMVRPLYQNWPVVREQFSSVSPMRFVIASVMFAVFLLCFRAFAWRRVLKGFGYKLPYAASARIWSTSELARYLPGAIWQVVGRVYLTKPYGVPGSIVSTSQILEVVIFLFANVLVAATCLLWFGQKIDSAARPWFITAMLLVPLLSLALHPKVFYGIANAILRRLGKSAISKRLRGKKLVILLAWMTIGLIWQSLAVYILVDPVLHLKPDWWWVVAGAYCLAWCAGFIAFWAPGGIGVRELVFVATMQVILPNDIRHRFPDPAALSGLLVLLGFILRLWTVAGELLLAAVANVWDYRGALNRPDAPGLATPADSVDNSLAVPAITRRASTPARSSTGAGAARDGLS